MKKLSIFALASLFLVSTITRAQENLSFLKGEKTIKVEYNYDNMKVGKKSEADYCSEKVADYNKKSPGSGDSWLKQWKNNRESTYQPKFEDLLNKYLSKTGISAYPSNEDAKYTLILKTVFTEPGFNVGVMDQSAYITVEASFVETANKDKVLAKKTFKKMPGATAFGPDWDVATRVSESYAKAGKETGKWILNSLK